MEEKSKNVTALIPFEVIEYIDKGRNPELCTYQMLYALSLFALPVVLAPQRRMKAPRFTDSPLLAHPYAFGYFLLVTVNLVRKRTIFLAGNCKPCGALGMCHAWLLEKETDSNR